MDYRKHPTYKDPELLAAFHLGRSINLFGFHARQACLLAWPDQESLSEMQARAAYHAIVDLQGHARRFALRGRDLSTSLLTLREGWWDHFCERLENIDPDELATRYESEFRSHDVACEDVVGHAEHFVRWSKDLVDESINGSDAEDARKLQLLFEFGEHVDQGIRPPNVHLYLLPEPEILQQSFSEDPEEPITELVFDTKARRGRHVLKNPFARIARQPGEIPPDVAWQPQLQSLVRRVADSIGIAATLPLCDTELQVVEAIVARVEAFFSDRRPGRPEDPAVVERGIRLIRIRDEIAGPNGKYELKELIERAKAFDPRLTRSKATYAIERAEGRGVAAAR